MDTEENKQMATLLSQAFKIDGTCEAVENRRIIKQADGQELTGTLFELNDTSRKQFYVGIYK